MSYCFRIDLFVQSIEEDMSLTAREYRTRHPQDSDYYRYVENYFKTFVQVYDEQRFDSIAGTVGAQNTLGVGLLRRSTGDTIGDIFRVLAGFFVYGLSFNDKSLSDVMRLLFIIYNH